MKAREVNFTGWNQKIAMDQINDAVGEVGGKVRAVVGAAILA